jgi:hypothetical protein
MASVMVVNPHAPCPECGDVRPPDLTPWPPRNRVVWQVARSMPIAVALGCVVCLAVAPMGSELFGCAFALVAAAGGLFLLAWPFHAAAQLVRRHAAEREYNRIYVGLLVLSWLASLLVMLAALIVLVGVRLLFR